jgi:hypothetical protein
MWYDSFCGIDDVGWGRGKRVEAGKHVKGLSSKGGRIELRPNFTYVTGSV